MPPASPQQPGSPAARVVEATVGEIRAGNRCCVNRFRTCAGLPAVLGWSLYAEQCTDAFRRESREH
eukprot:4708829-Lingulodinium_polyedra.AAC.1